MIKKGTNTVKDEECGSHITTYTLSQNATIEFFHKINFSLTSLL